MRVNPPTCPDLGDLARLFYDSIEDLGEFSRVDADQAPETYRQLLAHDHHMTVNIEAFHGCPVNVRVLEVQRDGGRYSRCILLTRTADDHVVQFGIVRLDVTVLDRQVREEIESERIPLGRVLIEHEVLRHVELCRIYRIACGTVLAKLLQVPVGTITYGRTALIHCNGAPAVELLEIVAPTSS